MNLRIENVGKVHSADIDLNGITVVTGPNGCGKSTVARAAFIMSRLSKKLDVYVEQERARNIISKFFHFFRKELDIQREEFIPFVRNMLTLLVGGTVIKDAASLIGKRFWKDPQSVYEYFSSYPSADLNGRPATSSESLKKQNPFGDKYPEFLSLIEKYIDGQNDGEYRRFVAQGEFLRVFKKQIAPVSSEGSTSRITWRTEGPDDDASLKFDASELKECKMRTRSDFPESFYLDTWHLLDIVDWETENPNERPNPAGPSARYDPPYSKHWTDYLAGAKTQNPTLDEANRQKATMSVVERLLSIIHGHLIKEKEEFFFKDEDARGFVRLRNVASGVKSMAAIYRIFENGWMKPGDFLIIDEPESNLHPEWQVRFAEFLVLLAKHLNVKLLLNTHSPYFLMAIEKFVAREELSNVFSAYAMQRDDSQGVLFTAKNVTGATEEIYRTMALPFDELRVL